MRRASVLNIGAHGGRWFETAEQMMKTPCALFMALIIGSWASVASALTNNFPAASPTAQQMGAIGLKKNGVVTWKCSGVFLRTDWMLTNSRCIDAVPVGSQLVVTDVQKPFLATSGINELSVLSRSAVIGNPDLALVRFQPPFGAPSLAPRSVSETPFSSIADLNCFGFSMVNGSLRLGQKLVHVPFAGSLLSTNIPLGFGENASPLDDGGVCFFGGAVVATLRHIDSTHVLLTDLTRDLSAPARGEIARARPAQIAAASVGLWPLTLSSKGTPLCLTARMTNTQGSSLVTTMTCGPVWAQGFQNVVLSSTANTTDVQLRHRGSGYCLDASQPSFKLQFCSSSYHQRFRIFYLNDGSVQILNVGSNTCVETSGGNVYGNSCNNGINGQRWFQGFGTN